MWIFLYLCYRIFYHVFRKGLRGNRTLSSTFIGVARTRLLDCFSGRRELYGYEPPSLRTKGCTLTGSRPPSDEQRRRVGVVIDLSYDLGVFTTAGGRRSRHRLVTVGEIVLLFPLYVSSRPQDFLSGSFGVRGAEDQDTRGRTWSRGPVCT